MQKSRFSEYSYTILLAVSLCVMAFLWQFGGLKEQKPDEISHFLQDATDDFWGWIMLEKSVEAVSAEVSGEDGLNGIFAADFAEGTDEVPGPGEIRVETVEDGWIDESGEVLADGTSGMTGDVQSDGGVGGSALGLGADNENVLGTTVEAAPEFYHADVSYFDDALFIGDSRTVGLYEYGGLGNAEVFAHSGMSIYKVFNEEFKLQSGEATTLEKALQTKKFGKVYIMLGINELGYDFNQTVERFSEAIALIRQLQPEALIFIQANLHITNKKSEDSELFNNTNINLFNQAVGELADGKQVFYLDVNPLYDDEEGGLAEEFTTDHAHILGKYYLDWVDFILQNAVKMPTAGI